MFVLYKNGEMIIHKDNEFIGKNLRGKYQFIDEILEMKQGMLDYDFKGETFAVVRTLDAYGWTLAGTTNYSEIDDKIHLIRSFILMLFGGMVLLVLGLAWYLSRSISIPIIRG